MHAEPSHWLHEISISKIVGHHLYRKINLGDQSEAAPTSASTWMDGALIGFCFLSLCHPRLMFFLCPFLSPDLSFFWAFETFPAHPPTHPSIYLPTCPSTFLPINTLSRYLPNFTYMATPTNMVATPIDPHSRQ